MKTKILTFLVVAACSGGGGDPPEVTYEQAANNCPPDNPCCSHTPESPIVIDLAGDGLRLSSAADGVPFPMRPGDTGMVAWTRPRSDDAWLTLDRNGNGRIDDATELFGSLTPQPPGTPDGYKALRVFDDPAYGGNGDGRVSPLDGVWQDLRLWRDTNHDAISDAAELLILDDVGVRGFPLVVHESHYQDDHGNEFRLVSAIEADASVGTVSADVWLSRAATPEGGQGRVVVQNRCIAWAYAFKMTSQGTHVPTPQVPCERPALWLDPVVSVADASGVNRMNMVIRTTGWIAHASPGSVVDAVRADIDPATLSGGTDEDRHNATCGWDMLDPDPYRAPPYWDAGEGNIDHEPGARPRFICQTREVVVDDPPGGGGCGD